MAIYYIVKIVNYECRASKYAFVPESWVKIRRPIDNMAVIVLPADDASTEERAKDIERPAPDWKQHLCEIVHTTDDYCDAMIATLQYNHEDPIPTQATLARESKAEKRISTDLTTEASTSKTKHNDATLDNSTNTKNERITQANTSKPLENDDNRENIFFMQLGNFFCQLQESSTELLNMMNEYRAPARVKSATPPEYDENNTRWTLRHPQPGPGLVELAENTKVYVSRDLLVRYTITAKAVRPLIRTLMTLIFKDSALSFCTLTFRKSKLDAGAVNALLDYVKRIARQNGWPDVDVLAFNECVRQKLKDVKRNSLSNNTL